MEQSCYFDFPEDNKEGDRRECQDTANTLFTACNMFGCPIWKQCQKNACMCKTQDAIDDFHARKKEHEKKKRKKEDGSYKTEL